MSIAGQSVFTLLLGMLLGYYLLPILRSKLGV